MKFRVQLFLFCFVILVDIQAVRVLFNKFLGRLGSGLVRIA